MNVVTLVQKFPITTLTIISLAGVGLIKQSISLRLARLETLQVIRAAEELELDNQIIQKMEEHGPYYK